MISRAPGLKLVVETLITSLKPIGNIVLICCAFFIIFGILGVQVNICYAHYFPSLIIVNIKQLKTSEEVHGELSFQSIMRKGKKQDYS